MYYVSDGPHSDRGGPGFRETLARALADVEDGTLYVEAAPSSAAEEDDFRRLFDSLLDGDATVVRPAERGDPPTDGAVDPGAHAARAVDRVPDDGVSFDVPGVESTEDLLAATDAESVAALRSSVADATTLDDLRTTLDDQEVEGPLRDALDPARAWPADEPAVVEDGAVVYADGVVDLPTGDDRASFVKMELVEEHADSLDEVAVEPAPEVPRTADDGLLPSPDVAGAFAALSRVTERDARFADRIRDDVDAGRTDPDETVVVMGRSHTLANRLRDRGFDPKVDPDRTEEMSPLDAANWALNDRVGSAVVTACGAARRLLPGRSGDDTEATDGRETDASGAGTTDERRVVDAAAEAVSGEPRATDGGEESDRSADDEDEDRDETLDVGR